METIKLVKVEMKYSSYGFSMIEILVAIIVLSVGLLGIAGLQIKGMQFNQGAYFRSQANYIAYDLIDRMRTNADGVSTGRYDSINSSSLPSNPSCIATTTGCSSADLANHDINEWASALSRLPLGSGTVSKAGAIFTVTIAWNESHDVADPNKNIAIEMRL